MKCASVLVLLIESSICFIGSVIGDDSIEEHEVFVKDDDDIFSASCSAHNNNETTQVDVLLVQLDIPLMTIDLGAALRAQRVNRTCGFQVVVVVTL